MDFSSTISIAGEVPDERKASYLRDLRNQLERCGLDVRVPDELSAENSRGDPAILSQLALGLVSGGGLVALIECLRSYIVRDRKVTIEIRNASGSQISVNAENIDAPSLEALLKPVVCANPK
jgi:hypothetical protein